MQPLNDVGPAGRLDSEKFFDLIHLRRREAKARDFVAGFVGVAGGQFQANLRNTDLFQFVDDAKYVHSAFRCDGGVGQQQVQDAAAGKPNLIPGNAQRFKAVADTANDLRICHLRLDANRVDVELHELAKTAGTRLVRAPHGRHLVAPERLRQIGVLRDHARQGNGEVEPKPQLLALRIRDSKDRLLGLLSRAAGEDVEILDRRRHERLEGHLQGQTVGRRTAVYACVRSPRRPLGDDRLARHAAQLRIWNLEFGIRVVIANSYFQIPNS